MINTDELSEEEIQVTQQYVRRIREENLYRDPEVLRELYHKQALSLRQIARVADVNNSTILDWMQKHGIERRRVGDRRNEYATFGHHSQGYEKWTSYLPSTGDKPTVLVHRLLAVAVYGFERVSDNDVHHKNGIPWDNRPSNIEIMSHSEHARMHGEKRAENGGLFQ